MWGCEQGLATARVRAVHHPTSVQCTTQPACSVPPQPAPVPPDHHPLSNPPAAGHHRRGAGLDRACQPALGPGAADGHHGGALGWRREGWGGTDMLHYSVPCCAALARHSSWTPWRCSEGVGSGTDVLCCAVLCSAGICHAVAAWHSSLCCAVLRRDVSGKAGGVRDLPSIPAAVQPTPTPPKPQTLIPTPHLNTPPFHPPTPKPCRSCSPSPRQRCGTATTC